MKKYDTQTPYLASYLIFRKNGKVAFLLRSGTGWMNGYYGLPSGKVENGENFIDCAIREANEETKVDLTRGNLQHILTVHRRAETDWVDAYFEIIGSDAVPVNNEPEIHSELEWFGVEELPDNVIPAVKFALQQIASGKHYAEFGWDTK